MQDGSRSATLIQMFSTETMRWAVAAVGVIDHAMGKTVVAMIN
jgi:hypothetical protein